ncbi:unnamed protein product, partial [Owenia fusiformis]
VSTYPMIMLYSPMHLSRIFSPSSVKPCAECEHTPKIQSCSGYNPKNISHNCPAFEIDGGSYTVTCKNEDRCSAKITCDRCYILQGETSRKCVKNKWEEDFSTSCIIDPRVECGKDNDCVGLPGRSTCSNCRCVCRSDAECIEYNMGSTCDPSVGDGTCSWGCVHLQPPDHGFFVYTPTEMVNGSTYTLDCGAGYELGGPKVRMCINGNWDGEDTFCVLAFDECRGVTCKHQSECIDGPGYFTCVCEYGYTGQFCEIDIDECVSSPCNNGGECIDLIGEYRCDCPTGWVGGRCQGEDLCHHINPCPKGSVCENVINKFAIPLCETNDDICEAFPTVNTREIVPNGPTPECDYDLLKFCNERDVKSKSTLTYSCNCREGFTGLNCETRIPSTVPNKICPRGFFKEGDTKTCQLMGSACDVADRKCCGCDRTFHEGIRWNKWRVHLVGMVPQWPSTVTRMGRCLCEACLEEHCVPGHMLKQWRQEKQNWEARNR